MPGTGTIRRHTAVACALAVVATLAAACADEADEPAGGGGGVGGGIEAALGALPVYEGDDDLVIVNYGDLAAAADLAGVEPPEDGNDEDAVRNYLGRITGLPGPDGDPAEVASALPYMFDRGMAAQIAETEQDVGFSVLDVDRFVERSTVPETVTVLTGRFDRGQMEDALADEGDGMLVAGDPEGGMDLEDRSPVRPVGDALWFDLTDDRLIASETEEDLEAARDAEGSEDTLADGALGDLAAALDAHDVYSATLIDGDQIGGLDPAVILGEDAPEAVADRLADLPTCTGLTAAATGIAHDGEPLIVLAVVSTTADVADDNEDILSEVLTDGEDPTNGRPWSDVLEVESIETDGTVTTITTRFAGTPAAAWRQSLLDRSFPPC